MVDESAIDDPRLPAVSARGTLLLAGLGLALMGAGLFIGSALLIPAGLSGLMGLIAGLVCFDRIRRGTAYPQEGRITLLAATFVNATLAAFVAVAGWIVFQFGI